MTTFSETIQKDNLTLVDFFAEWCAPCKMMKPILEELKTNMGDKVPVLKVDVDKNPQAAQSYQVRSVPTLVLFKNGNVLWRQSGVVTAKNLEQIISQHINANQS